MHSFSGKKWLWALVALGPVILYGCGGGGGNGAQGQTVLNGPDGNTGTPGSGTGGAFTPNYTSRLKSLSHWAQFPVSIYFVRDAEYTAERQALTLDGFDAWVREMGGPVSYQLTDDPNQAQITVQFVPKLDGNLIGWTSWSYDSGMKITHASIKIGLKQITDADIPWIGCHELGHAMGLDGHSDANADVMYASHVLGSAWALSQRDVNTVKTNYRWLFGRAPMPDMTVGAPVGTFEVRCYRPGS